MVICCPTADADIPSRWTKQTLSFECKIYTVTKYLIKMLGKGSQQNCCQRVQREASRRVHLETKSEEVVLGCDLDIQSDIIDQ